MCGIDFHIYLLLSSKLGRHSLNFGTSAGVYSLVKDKHQTIPYSKWLTKNMYRKHSHHLPLSLTYSLQVFSMKAI